MSLWSFTIDDASPYLSYSPSGDGPSLTNGWRTWYTGSQYSTSPNEVSQGESYHITSLRNASVSFQFYGTGVSLYGFTNSSFEIVIDDARATVNASTPSDSLLFSAQGLSNALHSVTLVAQPSNSLVNLTQSFAFDSAIAATPLNTDEAPPSPIFYDSTDTASLVYSGSWIQQTQSGVPNATISAPFYTTSQANASASFSFSGANAVVVNGLANSTSGLYSVSLDGNTQTFNATSTWIIPDALLYFRAGLDPTVTHELNITNLSSNLNLNSITVYQYLPKNATPASDPGDTNSHHKSSTNIGIIVGPVAGCVGLLVALGFFWLLRRRRSRRDFVVAGAHGKTSFSKPIGRPPIPHRPATTIISPMLATFEQQQQDPFAFDALSTYTGTSSEIHSSTNLLKASASHGRRSVRSKTSNETTFTQPHQMDSFSGWESRVDARSPPLPSSQYSISSGHRSDTSLDSGSYVSYGTQRVGRRPTVQSESSSFTSHSRSSRSSRQPPAPDYIPMSPRGPLPHIPVPSYDAALRTPELTPDEVKDMSIPHMAQEDFYHRPRRVSALTAFTALTAPPQYER